MNKNELIKVIKEKGPAFALGMVVGGLVAVLFERRAAIKKTLDEKVKQLYGRE